MWPSWTWLERLRGGDHEAGSDDVEDTGTTTAGASQPASAIPAPGSPGPRRMDWRGMPSMPTATGRPGPTTVGRLATSLQRQYDLPRALGDLGHDVTRDAPRGRIGGVAVARAHDAAHTTPRAMPVVDLRPDDHAVPHDDDVQAGLHWPAEPAPTIGAAAATTSPDQATPDGSTATPPAMPTVQRSASGSPPGRSGPAPSGSSASGGTGSGAPSGLPDPTGPPAAIPAVAPERVEAPRVQAASDDAPSVAGDPAGGAQAGPDVPAPPAPPSARAPVVGARPLSATSQAPPTPGPGSPVLRALAPAAHRTTSLPRASRPTSLPLRQVAAVARATPAATMREPAAPDLAAPRAAAPDAAAPVSTSPAGSATDVADALTTSTDPGTDIVSVGDVTTGASIQRATGLDADTASAGADTPLPEVAPTSTAPLASDGHATTAPDAPAAHVPGLGAALPGLPTTARPLVSRSETGRSGAVLGRDAAISAGLQRLMASGGPIGSGSGPQAATSTRHGSRQPTGPVVVARALPLQQPASPTRPATATSPTVGRRPSLAASPPPSGGNNQASGSLGNSDDDTPGAGGGGGPAGPPVARSSDQPGATGPVVVPIRWHDAMDQGTDPASGTPSTSASGMATSTATDGESLDPRPAASLPAGGGAMPPPTAATTAATTAVTHSAPTGPTTPPVARSAATTATAGGPRPLPDAAIAGPPGATSSTPPSSSGRPDASPPSGSTEPVPLRPLGAVSSGDVTTSSIPRLQRAAAARQHESPPVEAGTARMDLPTALQADATSHHVDASLGSPPAVARPPAAMSTAMAAAAAGLGTPVAGRAGASAQRPVAGAGVQREARDEVSPWQAGSPSLISLGGHRSAGAGERSGPADSGAPTGPPTQQAEAAPGPPSSQGGSRQPDPAQMGDPMGAGNEPEAESPDQELNRLFERLYPRIRDELRWDLRVQRERAGILGDPL